jgi:hypothetical protein
VFLFVGSLHGSCFFSNRGNSWLKDRKEITDINIKTLGLSINKFVSYKKHFVGRLLFPTTPKPLKQSTLFKKDNPFRFSFQPVRPLAYGL